MSGTPLTFELDDGAAGRAAFGMIVLQADESLEPEIRPVFDMPGIALYHTRIPSGEAITPESLEAMRGELPRAAALLPTARDLDVVAYACTSGATWIGTDNVAAAIRQSHPRSLATDPVTATLAACRYLGVRRLGFISPYVAEVSSAIRATLERGGIEIAAFASFEQADERVVARITERSLLEAVQFMPPDVDAVFASCTNLRAFGMIGEAEARTGRPMLTSNLVLSWHMLHLAGLDTAGRGPGRLFAAAAAEAAE